MTRIVTLGDSITLGLAAREAFAAPRECPLAEAPAWLAPVTGETQSAEPVTE